VISERVIRQISVVILRACDFFKIAKNQRCKQYSYGDKMVEKSKKSTNSERSEGPRHFAGEKKLRVKAS
jgi:hypothetical protein